MANTKVTGDLIASSTIATGNIADDAVTSDKISGITTAHIAEGSNLYYTNARADARIAAATTSDLTEGTNLYYTDARADARAALLVDSAPSTLNTLNELAAALGDDPNFATTVTNSIATKLPLAGGTLTGDITISSTSPELKFVDTNSFTDTNDRWIVRGGADTLIMRWYDNSASSNTDVLTLSSTAATFAGAVTGTIARFDTLNNNANSANIIYRSGTNTIVGNNASALVVQDGGDVVIGGTLTIGGNSAITRSGSTAQGRLAIWQNDTAIKGNNNLTYASQYLTVGVGTTGGYAGLRINADSIGELYLDFTEGASFTKRAQIQVDTNDNMYFRNTSNNSLRMTLLSGGNFGINDSSPDHTLSVGGPAKMAAGLLVGSMTLITNFTAPYFTHNTANLNVDLNLGNTSFWGHLEVTITGTYSNQNTPGKLTKIYAVGYTPGGTIYTNVSRVSDAMGPVVTQINLGEVRWDSTTSTYRIRIAHIASTGNQYWIQVKGFSSSGLAESTLPDLGISGIYTQSTTGLLAQIPSFKTEMATFSAATGSTSGIISANSGYITSFSNSATHASSNSALFVPVANGIKITQAGLIQVTLTQDFRSTGASSYASVSIRKNAAIIAYSLRTNSNDQWDMFNSTTTMQVAANDEIGFFYQATDFLSMDVGSWSQYSFIWTSL